MQLYVIAWPAPVPPLHFAFDQWPDFLLQPINTVFVRRVLEISDERKMASGMEVIVVLADLVAMEIKRGQLKFVAGDVEMILEQ